MQFTAQELIDRARTDVDDDHTETDGWIGAARWLDFFNSEYRKLYRKWVQAGLITPPLTDTPLTTNSTVVSGVLAIVGVGEDMGSSVRVLRSAQQDEGRSPFWRGSTAMSGVAESWSARGNGDNLTFELYPHASSIANGKYFVRYVPTLAKITSAASTVEIPFGCDDRLVLGMARRAGIKESAASRRMDQEILDADAEISMVIAGRLSPKVRRVDTNSTPMFYAEPGRWIFVG